MQPAASNPSAIEVQIDELILHGFSPGSQHEVADALERALREVLTARGVPAAWQANPATLDAGTIRLGAPTQTRITGAAIARAVYQGGDGGGERR